MVICNSVYFILIFILFSEALRLSSGQCPNLIEWLNKNRIKHYPKPHNCNYSCDYSINGPLMCGRSVDNKPQLFLDYCHYKEYACHNNIGKLFIINQLLYIP